MITEIKLHGLALGAEILEAFRKALANLGITEGEVDLCGLAQYPLVFSMVWKAPDEVPVAALLPTFDTEDSAQSVAEIFHRKWRARMPLKMAAMDDAGLAWARVELSLRRSAEVDRENILRRLAEPQAIGGS